MNPDEILKKYKRVAVVGGPVTAKSAITDRVNDRQVIHSDHIDHSDGWSNHSAKVKSACEGLSEFVVAGVAVDRAIRKGLEVDAIIHCVDAQLPLTRGQQILKKQIDARVKTLQKPTFTYRHTPPRKG